MPELAQFSVAEPLEPEVPATAPSTVPPIVPRYYAFLSYSHKDAALALWLQRKLERFRVPPALVGRVTANGPVPRRLTPVFRDQQELAAASDLGAELNGAIASSQYLVVLCSPAAAKSRWVNLEVEAFKRARPDGCVLAAIGAGEPFASDRPDEAANECFPPALRQRYDRRGRATAKRAEPLAADLREGRDGRRIGFLKIVAGMLGVGLDELVQRESVRRQRRFAMLTAASLAGMTITSGLAIFAFQSRDEARDQRRQAEGLVGFMLGDLRNKLEPIGRLDALDAVGTQALAYYSGQDKTGLSDASLYQRAKALALMGQIATARGDLDGALSRYGEALASTGELLRRDPDDANRLFEHAQNVFWIGQIVFNQGNAAGAEKAWRQYKALAARMIALDRSNPKWRLEMQYADANLGIGVYKQRRFAEAAHLFAQAASTIEALAAAEPANREYQLSLSLSLAWLADARRDQGRIAEAIAQRERQVALLERLLARSRQDVAIPDELIPAHEALGRLLASHGNFDAARRHLTRAAAEADRLLATEPENMQWRGLAASAQLGLADVLTADGKIAAARAQARAGCGTAGGLGKGTEKWRGLLRQCLMTRAELALQSGAHAEAQALASRSLQAARAAAPADNVEGRFHIAAALKLMGDAQAAAGNADNASRAWQDGLAALPSGVAERPWESGVRAGLLQRSGREREAAALAAKLLAAGYRRI